MRRFLEPENAVVDNLVSPDGGEDGRSKDTNKAAADLHNRGVQVSLWYFAAKRSPPFVDVHVSLFSSFFSIYRITH